MFLGLTSIAVLASLCLSLPDVKDKPLSTAHFALLLLALISLLHLTTYNHHTSRRSSTLILLFWPVYVLISAVRLRTMINTGQFSPKRNTTADLTRETLWLASIVFGLTDFMLELYSPERKWQSFKLAHWRKDGKIRLDDSDEEDEALNGVDAVNGGGAVAGKEQDGMESPVVTANIYERLTFSWLTRESHQKLN